MKKSHELYGVRVKVFWIGWLVGILPFLGLLIVDAQVLDGQMSEALKEHRVGWVFVGLWVAISKTMMILCVERHHPKYENPLKKIRRHYETGES